MFKHLRLTVWAPLLALLLVMMPLTASAQQPEFCWKSSYGRGVGTIPPNCNSDRVKETGMCYTPCKAGYEGTVTMCLRTCPSGYSNWGLTCHIDKPLLVGASFDRCNFSSSCPSGYTNAGLLCGLNTPGVPGGWKAAVAGPAGSGLDLSRELYDRGIGLAPSVCGADKENNVGLCYPRCKPNFTGVGPVCWGTCPAGWTDCGAGCAENTSQCTKVIGNQVYGVIKMTQSAAEVTIAQALGDNAKLALAIARLKALVEQNKAAIEAADAAKAGTPGYTAGTATQQLAAAVTPEEFAQAAMRIYELMDPTGVIAAAANFTYPTCDKVSPR